MGGNARRIDWKTVRPLIAAVVGFVLITGGMLIALQAIGLDRIRAFIESAGVWAPLAFIVIKMLTYVFAPLTSGPIQLSAGVLFGLIPGTLYTLVGEVIGGSIAFALSRRFGRPVVLRVIGAAGADRADAFVAQIVDWKTLAYARLFLFSLYDFISYAVGFSKLPYRTYLLVSIFVGAIPTFAASLLGTTLTEESSGLIVVYVLVGIACVLPLIFQKQIRRALKIDAAP
ncbi:MAG: VTT domain-containing protein [Chloroflexota bacterium]|nr:VTT domain-containing protein [Chloroflexota bacterium]